MVRSALDLRLARWALRAAAVMPALVLLALLATPSSAEFPYKATSGNDTNKYAYEAYMYIDPAQYPPSDIGGELWKYSSKNACDLYGMAHIDCQASVTTNPQELFGVTGASVDKAWETTTGRPDVVIAVLDSGIKWNDPGVMNDVSTKTWLNSGELPQPDWGIVDPLHPYDRNADGVVNIKDYCADLNDELDCGGTGDSRVRGAAGTADTDYNANGIIDPEDLIFEFSDGADTDGNGYNDDIAGWDSFEDDNDPYDEVQYGHGSGEAIDSVAEVNNGGSAGVCPNCMVMHMRVGDSFISDVNDWAEGVVYAADNGASVLQSAAGTLNTTRFAQEAIDYAYRRGVALIASAADESAGHHNQPTALEHAIGFNAIGEPESSTTQPRSYLDFRGCTNYGAYLTAAVPANSCSSEATGRASGMAGLIYGAAKNGVATGAITDYGALDGGGGVPAGRGVSAEEVDQIIATTADDLNFMTPTNYTARSGFQFPTERYPATAGWDPFFGYGRVNAERMVRAVDQNKIPPEADITSPKWFQVVDPDTATISVAGTVASRRSAKYSYTVSWALWSWRDTNAAPAYVTSGVTLSAGGDQTSPINGTLATINGADIRNALIALNGTPGGVDGPAVDPVTGRGDHQNRQIPDKFSVIVRVEVTAKDGAGTPLTNIDGGPLKGVGTKNFFMHDDPALRAGFPKELAGDGAASPRFADIDDDGADELIVATGNGEVHAYRASGGEAVGWPVFSSSHGVHATAPAYTSGEITTPVRASLLRSPSVGDIDRDGDLEVVIGDMRGRMHAWRNDGTPLPGFPVRTNPYFSAVQREDRAAGYYASNPVLVPGAYPGPMPLPNDPDDVPDLVNRRTKLNRTSWALSTSPVLANIDASDAALEIIAGAGDRHVYAFKADGSPLAGWPVMLRDPAKIGSYNTATHEITNAAGVPAFDGAKIIASPAAGDIDGDGDMEIVAVVNEQYDACPSGCSDGPVNSDDSIFLFLGGNIDPAGQRVYAIHADGAGHAGPPGNGPNPTAFLAGWPVKLASITREILPVVGNGPDGSPVLANVDGGSDLEVGVFATIGPAYILKSNGVSLYGKDGLNRDRTLLSTGIGSGSNSAESNSLAALGGGIFTRIPGSGQLAYAAPAAGIGKLFDLAFAEDQLQSDNHLSVWKLDGTRAQMTAFPREVNDLMFLGTPISADIDANGGEELLIGTAYSDLHAFSANGSEPGLSTLSATGWPKFTGGWLTGSAAVGDFDGNGQRDVAVVVREGRLYAWTAAGTSMCSAASWPEWAHDGWSTNNINVDATRPGRIMNVTVEQMLSGERLVWMAPGDDGRCGQASHYEIRYSASPITNDNWASATLIGSPAAGMPGNLQMFDVPGSVPPSSFFAIRAYDEAGNTASVSAGQSAVLNSDGDGCSDSEEDGLDPQAGGDRDKFEFYDFYDVTGERSIDLSDTLLILAHFGHGPSQDALDDLLDREIPNQAKPWRTAGSNTGVDLADALASLRSFGHDCAGPP